jgi:phosphoribosylglycinamide formyltransferase-1
MAPVHAIEIADGQGAGRERLGGGQVPADAEWGFHDREFTISAFTDSMPAAMRRFVILISGRGSNMQSLVQACRAQGWPATIEAVIASRPDASGLGWVREQGIQAVGLNHKAYPSREAFDAALAAEIDRHQPDYVLLAGFMRVLTAGFVTRYAGRLVNIHPSLLPAFPGLHTHAQALATGVRVHGCTLHFVTPLLDHGPIIAQGCVPVLADDTPDALAERVLRVEHQAYPAVARWLAEGRVSLAADGRVDVAGDPQRLFMLEAS